MTMQAWLALPLLALLGGLALAPVAPATAAEQPAAPVTPAATQQHAP